MRWNSLKYNGWNKEEKNYLVWINACLQLKITKVKVNKFTVSYRMTLVT
jgi:hypothetical protein